MKIAHLLSGQYTHADGIQMVFPDDCWYCHNDCSLSSGQNSGNARALVNPQKSYTKRMLHC